MKASDGDTFRLLQENRACSSADLAAVVGHEDIKPTRCVLLLDCLLDLYLPPGVAPPLRLHLLMEGLTLAQTLRLRILSRRTLHYFQSFWTICWEWLFISLLHRSGQSTRAR